MIDVKVFLLVSLILISLVVIIMVLFMKHLKIIHVFMEQIRREQSVLYKEIMDIKYNLSINKDFTKNEMESQNFNENQNTKVKTQFNNNKVNNQSTQNNSPSKSFKVSEQELLELIKDKKPLFKKEINIKSGEVFMDLYIKDKK